jgi:hypothetical protein
MALQTFTTVAEKNSVFITRIPNFIVGYKKENILVYSLILQQILRGREKQPQQKKIYAVRTAPKEKQPAAPKNPSHWLHISE